MNPRFLALTLTCGLLLTSCAPVSNQTISTQVQSYANANTPMITNTNNASLDGVSTQASAPQKGEEIAIITTSMGTMKVRFFPEEAPLSVANFKALAKKGYYDGLIFHRVIEDFVIQGGDPTGTGTGGESADGKPVKDERNTSRSHIFGALGMAKAGPNTATSQFYIVVNPAGTRSLDGGYTVFGQVFDGLPVAESIGAVETKICNVPALGCDKPIKDVVMQKIEIVPFAG